MYDEITKFVSVLISLSDPWNHHGEGVADLALKLGRETGMSNADLDLLKDGAILHDVGKLCLRTELLHLPRKLSRNEREEVELHVVHGARIIDELNLQPMIRDIVRHHHENWDGSGYPDHLKNDDIPEAARIVRICDVWESMLSPRSYREAFTLQFVKNYMQMGRGRQFDPRLLDMFFRNVLKVSP